MTSRHLIQGMANFVASLNSTKLRNGLRFPYASLMDLLQYLNPNEMLRHKHFIRRMTSEKSEIVVDALKEAEASLHSFERELQLEGGGRYWGQMIHGRLLYVICKLQRPLIAVETGVASGLSSCYMLEAMEENGVGRLISVDMPNYEEVLAKTIDGYHPVSILPEGKTSGWLIPEHLKRNWHLIVGRSQDVLERVLSDLEPIDLFVHDSEHTYDCMMYEYRTAWKHLRSGGLLLSDDIDWNDAFFVFASRMRRNPEVIAGHFGGLKK